MDVIAREVEFSAGAEPQTFYAVGQPDYLAILAVTPEGRIPLVRQYRPAIERFSLELPAGLMDPGEEPLGASARELLEETGYPAKTVHLLRSNPSCASRISNLIHSVFIETGDRVPDFEEEPGVAVEVVTPAELAQLVSSGELGEQLHLGTLMLAELRGFLRLTR